MPTFPAPETGILLTHFIVTEDIARSRGFYADVLGGEVVSASEPAIVQLANSWIIMNTGGGPTDDKPTATLTRLRQLLGARCRKNGMFAGETALGRLEV